MGSETQLLCWFCGAWRHAQDCVFGHTLGYIIASRHSSAIPSTMSEPRATEYDATISSRAVVCAECIAGLSLSLKVIDHEYLVKVASASGDMSAAECNADLGLGQVFDWSLEEQQMCGCWFLPIPAYAIQQSFHGLTLCSLVERGLRLTGTWRFPQQLLQRFVSRFGHAEDAHTGSDRDSLLHVSEAFGQENVGSMVVKRLANVRPEISDVAVHKYRGLPNPVFLDRRRSH